MNLFGQNNGKLFPEVEKKSLNVTQEKIEKLKELFPNIVSDGKIDWNILKVMLGENITEEEERYRFTWVGKNKAIQEPNIPTTSTLRPDKDSSKNWDTTENLYIEGDNLEVLKILQNSYNGKIKMIYIDPPYNTGSDFIYKDDFTLTMEEVEKQEGLRDKKGATKTVDRLTKNTKDSAKYHTNWLNMMYPRLSIARDLLTDDGAIFIHIDEHEVYNLQKICFEIFGEGNEVGSIIWDKRNPKGETSKIAYQHETIIVFCKNKTNFSKTNFSKNKENAEKMLDMVDILIKKYGKVNEEVRKKYKEWINKNKTDLSGGEKAYNLIDDNGNIYQAVSMSAPDKPETRSHKPLIHPLTQKECPVPEKGWRFTDETMDMLLKNYKIEFGKDETTQPRQKYYLRENLEEAVSSLIYYGGSDKILDEIFDNPKPIYIAKKIINTLCKGKEEIILDFFSGSSTTAHAIMQLNAEDGGNRKFIMVQLPELSYEGKKDKDGDYIIDEKTGLPEIQKDSEARKAGFNLITEIGKERIRRAGEKILEDNKDKDLSSLDIGFKTFKVDSSNFNEWDISYEAMVKAVKESSEGKYTTYKQDRNELDLVYEIMLKEGLQLTEEVEEIDFEGVTIYKIANGVICIFLGKLTKEIVDKIIEMKKEVQELFGLDNPTVILNETYLDSEIKANAKQNFISNGIVNIKTL